MQSRDYQEDLTNQVIEELSFKRKVCLQLPTGGGKTFIFSKIAQRFCRNTEKSVLILVHREELMYQAQKTIRNILKLEPALITSTTKKYQMARVYIGMVESTLPRLNLFTNVGLVIIDECHIANFNKVHTVFLNELILGVSATPVATSKKEPLNKYYSTIVCGPQIKELISAGFLSQNITRSPADIVDATMFAVDKMKGDYNERQMSDEYKLPRHVMNVVKNYRKYCKGEKTIIFNVTIEHSKEVTECFQHIGYNCRHIDATSSSRKSIREGFSSEREEILDWFKITKDAILCNVMIATVGFDEPTIRNVIINFATLSIAKFFQACGRGGRIMDFEFLEQKQIEYPYELETKDSFNIIDMGGNCVRFGDWNDDRDWGWIFNHPDVSTEGIAPVKTCPNCEAIVHAAVRVCTHKMANGEFCLHEFAVKPRAKESDIEEMILMTKGINIDDFIERGRNKHEYYPFLEMGDEIVFSMYKIHGGNLNEVNKRVYFRMYYERCCEWYAATLAGKNGNMEDISRSGWHIKRAKNNFNNLINKYNDKYDFKITHLEKDKIYELLTDSDEQEELLWKEYKKLNQLT